MRAVVQQRYGGSQVLQHVEAPRPIPSDGEILVRVRASSVNPVDWHLMRGRPVLARFLFGGLLKPGAPGQGRDVAGVVEAIGAGVAQLQPGDAVFGFARGAWAEFVAAPADSFRRVPATLSLEEAAGMPIAGVTATQALRDVAKLEPGQRLLMNGASGGVGSHAVQVAKAWGATVTAVTSTANVDRVRALGADEVIDYTTEDFVPGGRRFDVVFDCVGNRTEAELIRVTRKGGVVVMNGGAGSTARILLGFAASAIRAPFRDVSFRSFITRPNGADLDVLRELAEAGKLRPLIDRSYPLAEIRAAVDHAETFHARGKLIVTI